MKPATGPSGDFDADEAAFLAEHPRFQAAMRARCQTCPPPAAIRARALNAVPPDVASELDAHVAGCRACQTIAEAFAAAEDEGDDDVPRESIWRRVESRRAAPPFRGRIWTRVVPYAAAASLLLVAGALSVRLVRLERDHRSLVEGSDRELAAANARVAALESQLAGLRARDETVRPQVNLPIVDLAADATRSGSSLRTISFARDTPAVVFVLTVPAAGRAASYALDVADASGRPQLHLSDLRATPERTINVALPRASVPDGRISLVLYALRGDRREQVAAYSILVTTE